MKMTSWEHACVEAIEGDRRFDAGKITEILGVEKLDELRRIIGRLHEMANAINGEKNGFLSFCSDEELGSIFNDECQKAERIYQKVVGAHLIKHTEF